MYTHLPASHQQVLSTGIPVLVVQHAPSVLPQLPHLATTTTLIHHGVTGTFVTGTHKVPLVIPVTPVKVEPPVDATIGLEVDHDEHVVPTETKEPITELSVPATETPSAMPVEPTTEITDVIRPHETYGIPAADNLPNAI